MSPYFRKTYQERRKYIRISTVFPVEFSLTDKEGRQLTPWLEGFTNNIAKGGICLVINDLWRGFWTRLQEGALVLLNINLPFKRGPILTRGVIIWRREKQLERFNQYLCGVEFVDIKPSEASLIFKYALWKKILPLFVLSVVVISSGFSFYFWVQQEQVRRENRKLVSSYMEILDKAEGLKEALGDQQALVKFFKDKQNQLQEKIALLEREVSFWRSKYKESLGEGEEEKVLPLKQKISSLEEELTKLKKENEFFKRKFKEKKSLTGRLAEEFTSAEKEKSIYIQQIIKGMYQWITSRQDLKTGLVLSYEGDPQLNKVAFSYDQALACIVFTLFGDYSRAKKILDFYLKKVEERKPIYNAYYTNGDVFEYIIHSGVNAWIGLAALNYVKVTHQKEYLKIGKAVGEFLEDMMDKEGGIKGGPNLNWYSTEHNLDSYAFFKMFYQLTANQSYREDYEKIKRWIDRYSYTDKGVPVNRGKGDATIATDTYAWSITALGPGELLSLDMDPEEIINFAIKNCQVKTTFSRRDGKIEVVGFDFSKARNIPRGGVISCEWTAQMILAFNILASYYKDRDEGKYSYYFNKAKYYFKELQKMVINSPSPVGKAYPTLPYASQSYVDTGHGWRTPKGDKIGSLSATVYFLIAYQGFNPLRGEELSISLKGIYERRVNRAYSKVN